MEETREQFSQLLFNLLTWKLASQKKVDQKKKKLWDFSVGLITENELENCDTYTFCSARKSAQMNTTYIMYVEHSPFF